jgi:hypothetical protein
MALLAVGLSVIIYTCFSFQESIPFGLVAAGAALLFFAYGLLLNRTTAFNSFVSPAMVIAAFFASLGAYLSSFHSYDMRFPNLLEHRMWGISIICLYVPAIIMWGFGLKSVLSDIRIRLISLCIIVSCVLIAAPFVLPFLLKSEPDTFWVILFSNIACFVLSAGFIACSFRLEDRRIFWAGVLFAALVITSRFFEYETGLLIKAVVFITCGICLILAGVGFENYLKRRRLVNE